MTIAISESRIFQNIGRDIYFEAALAPKPIALNHRTLATDAPIAKYQRSASNWFATLPKRMTVSR